MPESISGNVNEPQEVVPQSQCWRDANSHCFKFERDFCFLEVAQTMKYRFDCCIVSDVNQWFLTDVCFVFRFEEPESASDDRTKDVWVDRKPRYVPSFRHDMRQLSEAAGLHQRRNHAPKTGPGSARGTALIPSQLAPEYTTSSTRGSYRLGVCKTTARGKQAAPGDVTSATTKPRITSQFTHQMSYLLLIQLTFFLQNPGQGFTISSCFG